MIGAIDAVAQAALNHEIKLDVLANNLANLSTVGFKEDRPTFNLPEADGPADADQIVTPSSAAVFTPDRTNLSTYTRFDPGGLEATGNQLDMAIDGKGFFCIQTPQGDRYTRKGDFTVDSQGVLVTQEGLAVLGEGGPITITGGHVQVDHRGAVTVDGAAVGKLRIVEFDNPLALQKHGDVLFGVGEDDPGTRPARDSRVKQGVVEASNVDAIRLMTEMIDTLRGYESYMKMMQSMDSVTLESINQVGTLA